MHRIAGDCTSLPYYAIMPYAPRTNTIEYIILSTHTNWGMTRWSFSKCHKSGQHDPSYLINTQSIFKSREVQIKTFCANLWGQCDFTSVSKPSVDTYNSRGDR